MVEQIRAIGQDPQLLKETLHQVRRHVEEDASRLHEEQGVLQRELRRLHEDLRRLAGVQGEATAGRLADLQQRIAIGEGRMVEVQRQLQDLDRQLIQEPEVASAFLDFEGLWAALSLREQAQVIHLLIERVEYDGREGTLSLTFHPTGIQALAVRREREQMV